MGAGICIGLYLAAVLAEPEQKLEVFTVFVWAYLAWAAAMTVLLVLRRTPPEKLYPRLVMVFGTGYLLLMVPLAIPDELSHYYMSLKLSNVLLFRWDRLTMAELGYFDFSGFTGHYNVSSGYMRVLSDLFSAEPLGEEVNALSPLSWGFYLPFLPQALTMTAARLMRLRFVPAFLLARLANLVFYALCVRFAIKNAPRYKVTLGFVSLLPMAIHQAASLSYDSYTNGVALCFAAMLLKCLLEEGPLSRRDFLLLAAAALLLAPAKVAYTPLLLLVLLIPAKRFRSRRSKWQRLVCLLFCGALVTVVFQLSSMLSVGGGTDALNWEGEKNYTLGFVLSHPGETAWIFFNTIRACWFNWVYTYVGGALGGMSLLIPREHFYAWVVMTALCVTGLAEPEHSLSPGQRLAFLGAGALVVLAFMGVMMLAWTSDTHTVIQGVQGRYFLPLSGIVLPAVGIPLPKKNELDLRPMFPVAAAILHCTVLLYVLQYTLAH